jgi:hypothetical protein
MLIIQYCRTYRHGSSMINVSDGTNFSLHTLHLLATQRSVATQCETRCSRNTLLQLSSRWRLQESHKCQ